MSKTSNKLYFVSLIINRDFWSCISPFMYGSKKASIFDYYHDSRMAAYNGYLGLFKEKNPHIPTWRVRRYHNDFALSGNLPLLQLCMKSIIEDEARTESYFHFDLYNIARAGHHHIIVWVFENNLCFPKYDVLLNGAVDGGRTHIVEWVLKQKNSLDKLEKNDYKILLSKAAQQGNLQLVQLFYEKYYGRPNEEIKTFDISLMHNALSNNHIAIAEWIITDRKFTDIRRVYQRCESDLIRLGSLEAIRWYDTNFRLANPKSCILDAIARGNIRILKLITESEDFQIRFGENEIVKEILTGYCVSRLIILKNYDKVTMQIFRYVYHKYRNFFRTQPDEVILQAYKIACENCHRHPKFLLWICNCFQKKIPLRTLMKIPPTADDKLVKMVVSRHIYTVDKSDVEFMIDQENIHKVVLDDIMVDHMIKYFSRSDLYDFVVKISKLSTNIRQCITRLYFFLIPPRTEEEFSMTTSIIHELYEQPDLSVKILRQIVHS